MRAAGLMFPEASLGTSGGRHDDDGTDDSHDGDARAHGYDGEEDDDNDDDDDDGGGDDVGNGYSAASGDDDDDDDED